MKTVSLADIRQAEREFKAPRRFSLEPFLSIDVGEEPEWLIANVLPSQGLGVIYGEAGCGKSFLAADMGLHITIGDTWGGKMVRSGAVVYITAEGASGFRKRIVAFREAHSISEMLPFFMIADAPNLGQLSGDADALITSISEQCQTPVQLVIIDTLARTMGGGDENSATDMGQFIANCNEISSALDCLVLLVHHSGKDGTKGARGSSALKGAADVEISVTGTADRRTATLAKLKDGEDGISLAFKLRQVSFERHDRELSSCVLEPLSEWQYETQERNGGHIPVTGPARIALDVLRNAVAEVGQELPAVIEKPDKFGCPIAVWRKCCGKVQITEADTPEARRKAFKRAVERLELLGKIGVYEQWAWLND